MKQAKKNSFKIMLPSICSRASCAYAAIFRRNKTRDEKHFFTRQPYTSAVSVFFFFQFCFPFSNACSVLRSINFRKAFIKVLVKTCGFSIVRKSISSFMFCTQNVFVVDEESRGWGIDCQARNNLQIPGGMPGG